jgi:hypothetical protein
LPPSIGGAPLRKLLALLLFTLAPILTKADTVIDTSSFWNGVGAVQPWGPSPNTDTFGQTFTVGDTFLSSFSFNIDNSSGLAIPYTARVYQWNSLTQRPVGPALYISSLSSVASTGSYQVVTATPGINLTSGLQYAALFTTSGAWQGGVAPGAFFAAIFNNGNTGMANVYPGGGFVDASVGNNPNLLTSASWNSTPGDLWFRANFLTTPVPEPSSLILIITGLLAIGITLKNRPRLFEHFSEPPKSRGRPRLSSKNSSG